MNKIQTKSLVAIPLIVFLNLLAFLLQSTLISTQNWAVSPLRLTQSIHTLEHAAHEIATLLTHLFLHANTRHLIVNMITLVFFGSLVEREFGALRFPTYYLASGVAGALGVWAFNADQTVILIGASGGVSGIIGAFSILLIRRRAPLTILSALGGVYILTWWLPDQVIGSIQMAEGTSDSNNGYLAHLLGFIAGVILAWRYCGRSLASSTPIVVMPPLERTCLDEEHSNPNNRGR